MFPVILGNRYGSNINSDNLWLMTVDTIYGWKYVVYTAILVYPNLHTWKLRPKHHGKTGKIIRLFAFHTI